jgi:hypothetical protein
MSSNAARSDYEHMLITRVEFSGLDKLTAGIDGLQRKLIPEAIALTVNRVGLQFQRDEREHIAQAFVLRRPDFIKREGVKRLSPAATASNPSVIFGVSDRADFLDRFEKGDTKRARSGGSVAIPRAVRRTKADLITRINRPRQLIARNKQLGAKGVFAITKTGGPLKPGVYQRVGKGGRKELTFLYSFVPEVPTAPILQFEERARGAASRFEEFFAQAWAETLRKAGLNA